MYITIKPRGHEVKIMPTSWALHKGANIHERSFPGLPQPPLYHTT